MNANQQGLLTKARRSLAAARRLAADGDRDFAVSRAYYAMFYTAQAFVLVRGLRFSKHSAVIAAFGQEFAKDDETLREFHHGPVEAQDARNVGDYQIDAILSDEDVQSHLDRADRFIQLVSCL
ncbi:MAG: HEPN domain-containing protein [Bryobacteraceae bacterium]